MFFMTALAAGLSLTPVLWAAPGDEAIEKIFPSGDLRDSHESMVSQKKTLNAIQNGFLAGDTDAVESEVSALNRNMRAVSRTIPETATENVDTWALLYKIVTESQAMKDSTDKGDFTGAYDHYTTLTGLCVKCHAGTMNVPAPALEPAPAAVEQSQTP